MKVVVMSFKTPKGTVLPLRDIKGKLYLDVAYRVIWFREEFPSWTIKTSLIFHDKTRAIAFCEILDDQGRLMASGTKTESLEGFYDFIEKCETGAVGRALGFLGFGTQFALDLDGDRLADAPHSGKPKQSLETKVAAVAKKPVPPPPLSSVISFQAANDLRAEGLKLRLTMDQMSEIIKRVAGVNKFGEITADKLALVKAEFLKNESLPF